MKKIIRSNFKSGFAVLAMAFFMTSCSNDSDGVFDTPDIDNEENPDAEATATLMFSEADPSTDIISAEASGEVGTTVPGRVIFTSTDISQLRMYITQNISGQGDMPFNSFDLGDTSLRKVLKGDGSIDLDGSNKKEIDFTFDLPVPDIDNGQIVYTFWTTTGKGDFRDIDKRLALGAGTITVTVGNGTNPAAEVRSFTDITLFAPALDGTTETFFSLLNESEYRINTGREFRNFWDFGYYFGEAGDSANDQASLASTAAYNASFGFPVEGLEPADDEANSDTETLNQMFFTKSTLTVDDFDGIVLSGDLNNIAASDSEKVTNLVEGDIIEFVDNYGKKGLIKVVVVEPGSNVTAFIRLEVKVQP